MTHRQNREGRMVLAVAVLVTAATMILPALARARDINMRGAQVMLFARGSAGVGVNGQVELVLTSVTSETSYAWTFCNDGSDEILISPGSTKGTALTAPTDNAAGTPGSGGVQVTMGTVGRILIGDCIEFADLKAKTAVLQGETTTQAYSVWGTR